MARRRGRWDPSQPDKRRFNRWTDQHGRTWEGIVDIDSGGPIGPLAPVGWLAPLEPEQQYFRFSTLDNRLTIDYNQWIKDREGALRTYRNRRARYARKLYGEQAGKMLALDEAPAELDREVGVRPQPVEPVLAAASGNRWILGLSDNKPSWAETFFPTEVAGATLETSRGITPEALARYREMFPDAGEADDELSETLDESTLSPDQADWIRKMREEEAALEGAGEI